MINSLYHVAVQNRHAWASSLLRGLTAIGHYGRVAAVALTVLSCVGLPAEEKAPVTKIVLPAEPIAQVVTKRINLLDLIRAGQVEYYISSKYDVMDEAKSVFSFLPDGLLRVSGRGYGGMTTNDSYKDYHLVIEFKWGELTWGKREKAARDSGILVHSFGPQGANNNAWMASIEAQIIEGGVGDILVLSPKLADGTLLQASISAEVGRDRDKERIWLPDAPREVMTGGRLNWQKRDVDWKDNVGIRGKDDVESVFGEWSRLEIIAKGDTLEYYVNGVLVNRAFEVKPSQGRIQL